MIASIRCAASRDVKSGVLVPSEADPGILRIVERPDEAGISHLIEHLVFKGTERRRTAQEISEIIDGVGAVGQQPPQPFNLRLKPSRPEPNP